MDFDLSFSARDECEHVYEKDGSPWFPQLCKKGVLCFGFDTQLLS